MHQDFLSAFPYQGALSHIRTDLGQKDRRTGNYFVCLFTVKPIVEMSYKVSHETRRLSSRLVKLSCVVGHPVRHSRILNQMYGIKLFMLLHRIVHKYLLCFILFCWHILNKRVHIPSSSSQKLYEKKNILYIYFHHIFLKDIGIYFRQNAKKLKSIWKI